MFSPYTPTANFRHPTCEECRLCRTTQSPFMRGVGYPRGAGKLILCVGEMPGYREDAEGMPFDFARKSNTDIFKRTLEKYLGDGDHGIIFTNAVRCSTPGYTSPTGKQIKFCQQFLHEEIHAVHPDVIAVFGNSALRSVMNLSGIKTRRRTVLSFTAKYPDGEVLIPVVPCYSPGAAKRDKNLEQEFEDDIAYLANVVKHGAEAGLRNPYDSHTILKSCILDASLDDVLEFAAHVHTTKLRVALDYETNSLSPRTLGDKFSVSMISLSTIERTIVVHQDTNETRWLKRKHMPTAVDAAMAIIGDQDVELVGHNIKYEMHCTDVRHGITDLNFVSDTMALHAVLNPINTAHDLKSIVMHKLNVGGYDDDVKKVVRGGSRNSDRWMSPEALAVLPPYAALDSRYTAILDDIMMKELAEEDKEFEARQAPGYPPTVLYREIIIPALKELWWVERNGLPIDVEYAHQLDIRYANEIKDLLKRIHNLPIVQRYTANQIRDKFLLPKRSTGNDKLITKVEKIKFNPNSPAQLGEIVFGNDQDFYFGVQLNQYKRTKTGGVAVDKEVFGWIKEQYAGFPAAQFVELVEQYKGLEKKRSTYVIGVLEYVSYLKRVHATYQLLTRTGRLSAMDPNLQNVVNDTVLRMMYRALPGWCFIEGDESQVELRCLAGMSGDVGMCDIYYNDEDLHQETVNSIICPKKGDDPKKVRTAAKRVNFGIVYLISNVGLGKLINEDKEVCQRYIDRFYVRFPATKQWQDNTKLYAQEHGCVYTLFGNKRTIENCRIRPRDREEQQLVEEAFRQACNAPIQGTASYITMVSLMGFQRWLRDNDIPAQVVNTVHDSVLVHCREDYRDEVAYSLKWFMENEAFQYLHPEALNNVPLKSDIKCGPNWAELENLEVAARA